jgi:retron-type reverse transcriptase
MQDFNQENSSTVLQKEDFIAQKPKFNRLKNLGDLRITGFNFCKKNFYKRKWSIYSTLCVEEKMQANKRSVGYRRSFTTKVHSKNSIEWVLAMKLKQMVIKCKNKDKRYGNLIQIIGSPSIINIAYLMVKSNSGIPVKKADGTTLNSANLKDIETLSRDTLRGSIKFSPVRRVLIPKLGKTVFRSLTLSSLGEKIVQKAIELILTAVFEKIFLECNYGSRLSHSCNSALKYLQLKVTNVFNYPWVIEGDLKSRFDCISHSIILKGLKRKIDCPITLNLIKGILDAGYIFDEDLKKFGRKKAKVYKSVIGISQSVVLSPLFSSVVFHELDIFIEDKLKKKFTKGRRRRSSLVHCSLNYPIKRKLGKSYGKIFSKDANNSNFRRLYYVRYGGDWVIFVVGPFKKAKIICNQVSKELKKVSLTLNLEKKHITLLKNGKSRFLWIEFVKRKNMEQCLHFISTVKKNTMICPMFALPNTLHVFIRKFLRKLKNKGFVKLNKLGEFYPKGKSNCIFLTHRQILNYVNSYI